MAASRQLTPVEVAVRQSLQLAADGGRDEQRQCCKDLLEARAPSEDMLVLV